MLFRNESFRGFIDAIMMFGADMRQLTNYAAIEITKPTDQRRALAWMVATLMAHDVDAEYQPPAYDADSLTYCLEPLHFTLNEYHRWYERRAKRIPEDLVISESVVICWTVASLAAGSNQMLCAPFAADRTKHALVARATEMGFPLSMNSVTGAIVAEFGEGEAFARRLTPIVPRGAWDRTTPVEV